VSCINIHTPKHHGDVAVNVPMHAHRAEQARYVARGLPFGDGNILTHSRAVIARTSEGGQTCNKKNGYSEEQSAH
jgi:hypothetical protein